MAREQPATSIFTSDFRHEYEAERERWLRIRFLWYTGVVGVLSILSTVGAGIAIVLALDSIPAGAAKAAAIGTVAGLIGTAPYVVAFLYALRHALKRDRLVQLVYALIIINGVLQLVSPLIQRQFATDVPQWALGAEWIFSILFTHVFACLFLPLTPREAFRPLIPLLLINAGFMLLSGDHWVLKIVVIVLSPLIGAPGALICWWRYSRFRDRFTLNQLRGKYAELRHELISARQIHEALFPKPIEHGPVRFTYVYEPMRQIGGDYLYAREVEGPDGGVLLHVVLIDVTGHGIPAALTVNRLHGELERIFAESPDVGPGDVLTLLNRYVHLTLATHSVYVTAICFKVDAGADRLEYASGGHPPAFLRAVDGSIEQLDSTSFVLGAAAGPDFVASPRLLRFGPGDVLIAYTDGATEARDEKGRYLGIAGMQGMIAGQATGGGAWPASIAQGVERHRHGPTADDTLVVEISRALERERTAPAMKKPVYAGNASVSS